MLISESIEELSLFSFLRKAIMDYLNKHYEQNRLAMHHFDCHHGYIAVYFLRIGLEIRHRNPDEWSSTYRIEYANPGFFAEIQRVMKEMEAIER